MGHNTSSLGNIPDGHRTGRGGGEWLRRLHGLSCQELVSRNLIPTHVDTTLPSLGEAPRDRGFRACCPSDLNVRSRDTIILFLQMTKFAGPVFFTEGRGSLARLFLCLRGSIYAKIWPWLEILLGLSHSSTKVPLSLPTTGGP